MKTFYVTITSKWSESKILSSTYLPTYLLTKAQIFRFSFNALDELNSFETEKEILEHMNKMRASGASIQPNTTKPKRPLRPIIITRDAVQKEVFGLGYKNLPVMSIEEFYDQRYANKNVGNFALLSHWIMDRFDLILN